MLHPLIILALDIVPGRILGLNEFLLSEFIIDSVMNTIQPIRILLGFVGDRIGLVIICQRCPTKLTGQNIRKTFEKSVKLGLIKGRRFERNKVEKSPP